MDTTLSRRAALARLAAIGITVPALSTISAGATPATPLAATPVSPGSEAATPATGAAPLTHRGINYDVGTEPAPGITTRPDSNRAYLKPEFEAIRDELHCTTVGIFGDNVDRLVEGATAAMETGLHARVQPRLINASIEDTLATLTELGEAAEQLSTPETEIILDLGCELSLFAIGIIPGDTFEERLSYLVENLDQLPEFNDRLGAMLHDAITEARKSFSGRLIYSSGSWEDVDWSGLDIVGVDLYRDESNATTYIDTLRSYLQHGKPVWITEFGCCSYEGAQDLGGSAYGIVDWTAEPPQLNGDYTRSESVQKDYILDLLDIFEQEGVEGAFVYQFIEPILPHTTDPQYDLDMAAYSVVKVYGPDSDHPYESTGYWEPKEAFDALAERYGSINDQAIATPVA